MRLLSNLLIIIASALLNFLTVLFLLRFYFQIIKLSFQNPFAQMVVALTNFAVKPLRRTVPSMGKYDITTLLLAYLTQWLLALITLWLLWIRPGNLLSLSTHTLLGTGIMALLGVISIIIYVFIGAVLLYVILSWVHPHSPAMPFLHQLTNPVMRHFRKWVPLVSNVDLSPLVFVLVAQLLLYLLSALEQLVHANFILH